MVLPAAIAVSLLIALLRGGRISSLSKLRFRTPYLLAPALGMRLLLAWPSLGSLWCTPAPNILPYYGGLAYIISLFLLLFVIALNLPHAGLKLVAVGLFANLLVISFNSGQMPVDPSHVPPERLSEVMTSCETDNQWSNFSFVDEKTRFWFLGDQFLVSKPWPISTLLSIGDFIIMAGVFLFFQKAMKPSIELEHE